MITRNYISADRTEVYVGDTVIITGVVEGEADFGEQIEVMLYINGESTDYLFLYPEEGSFSIEYKFYITFEESGTYDVYTDAISVYAPPRPR